MKSGYKVCKKPGLCGVKSHRLGTTDAKCMKASTAGGSAKESKISAAPQLSSPARDLDKEALYRTCESLGDDYDERLRNPKFVEMLAEARGIPLDDAMEAAKFMMGELDKELEARDARHKERADGIIAKTPAGTVFKRGMTVVVDYGRGETRIVKLASVRSPRYGEHKLISGDTIDAYEDIYVQDWEDGTIITS